MFTKGEGRRARPAGARVHNARSPMSFQVQPLQHVYPPQVQYVEGGDAVYTNGALYVRLPSPRGQAWATSRTFLMTPPTSSHSGLCVRELLHLLWVMLDPVQRS